MPNMRMPTVMQGSHMFSRVPSVNIGRSTFDRSHGYKTTFNAGWLVPFYADEALPGDTFNLQATFMARLTTPLKPLMDNMYFETFFFFVPLRLIWSDFVKFMGEQEPNTFTAYAVPVFNGFIPTTGDLSDYLGLPLGFGSNLTGVASLWHRAYNLVYNEWFRDENLVASAVVDKGAGPDTIGNYVLRKRGKRHDYFTSCLPWPQKASAGVSLPLGSTAPVRGIALTNAVDPTDGNPANSYEYGGVPAGTGGAYTPTAWAGYASTAAAGWVMRTANAGISSAGPLIYADLSAATAATINSIRQAFQIQKFLERDARGGTRYTEKIRSHFGVVSPDARLQRSEYLGGGSTPIIVSPIAQTTQTGLTGGSTPLGNLGAMGTMTARGHGFSKSFTEHGVLLGIMNVRADLTYSQGIERQWLRSTPYDFYWPEFAHLGEQVVQNKELFYNRTISGDAANDAAFGYQERYAEYRYKPSKITGLFRPDATSTLALWHLSEQFAAGAFPTLGQTFIEDQTSSILDRCVAVPSEPDFYLDSFIRLICARPMPVFGVPGMVDHF